MIFYLYCLIAEAMDHVEHTNNNIISNAPASNTADQQEQISNQNLFVQFHNSYSIIVSETWLSIYVSKALIGIHVFLLYRTGQEHDRYGNWVFKLFYSCWSLPSTK